MSEAIAFSHTQLDDGESRSDWLRRQPHCVYEYLDADGVVVYVGCTHDPARRWRAHTASARSQRWLHLVVSERQRWFPNRQAAEDAEREAVEKHRATAWNLHLRGFGDEAETTRRYRANRPDQPRAANQFTDGRHIRPQETRRAWLARVRHWAIGAGLDCCQKGRIPKDITGAYLQAHPEDPEP